MFSSVNQTILKITKEIKRYYNKKSNILICNSISRHHVDKLGINLELDGSNHSFCKRSKLNIHKSIRSLSTNQSKIKRTSIDIVQLVSKEESREFMALFPEIVKNVINSDRYTDIPDVTKRLAKVLQHNVSLGKKIRGLTAVGAYKMLEKPENLTGENIKLAYILGWCLELFTAYMLITDDVLDNSETRRGNICWHRKPKVGLQALNDAGLIGYGLYHLLKMYLSSLACYVPILELFTDCSFKILLGQTLDFLCIENNKPRLDLFTIDRYLVTTKYKSGYFTFYPAAASAMYLANTYDKALHSQCKTILLNIGQFYQVQDDFLDCFGKSEVTGKIGTDIKDGKCSWLAVVALEKATSTQRAIMEEHYGRPEEESIQTIKALYEELNLPSIYAKYEEENVNLIRNQIRQLPKELPCDLMFKLMEVIYKRKY